MDEIILSTWKLMQRNHLMLVYDTSEALLILLFFYWADICTILCTQCDFFIKTKRILWSNNIGCVTVIGEKFYYFACFNDVSEVLFIIPSLLMSIHSFPNKKKIKLQSAWMEDMNFLLVFTDIRKIFFPLL